MKKHWLPAALILLAALLFAPLCRTFVREVIVIPLLYLLWLGRFLLQFVPQASLWPVFVLLLFLIVAAAFVSRSRYRRPPRRPAPAEPGRVGSWAYYLAQARQESYYQWRLGQQMQKLALEAIAQHKGQSLKETRQQLRNRQLNLPPELQAYFEASLRPLGYLPAFRRLAFWRHRSPSPLELEPERVLIYLENLDREDI